MPVELWPFSFFWAGWIRACWASRNRSHEEIVRYELLPCANDVVRFDRYIPKTFPFPNECGICGGLASDQEWRCSRGTARVMGYFPFVGLRKRGTHILFSYMASQVLWSFVREAVGPDWESHDLADFLQTRATQIGRTMRLFWLDFAALT